MMRKEKNILNKLTIGILAGVLTGFVFMTTSQAAPVQTTSGNLVPVEKTYTVNLTQPEILVIKRALELASGTCQTQRDGCTIGLSRDLLNPKLDNAQPTQAPVVPNSKKENKID